MVANSRPIVPDRILPRGFECSEPSQEASQIVSSRTRMEVFVISRPETLRSESLKSEE
jgi:hypothetical protein